MNRRNFMLNSSAVLAASALRAEEKTDLIDCHVYLGSNPFRQLTEFPDPSLLLKRGVTEAWVGAFEGLLRHDVAAVNRELARACNNYTLRPCGTINLSLPDWQDDVKRCALDHRMGVIRLHPNYHGYDLKAPAFRGLLALAAKHRLLVQLVVQMEDERTQNPQVRVAPVDLKPLPALLKEQTDARVMLLNANATMLMRHLQECANVWVDFAMIEGVGGVETLLKTWPVERVVFGSFAPVFYWESARLKMQESALNAEQRAAVQALNAVVAIS